MHYYKFNIKDWTRDTAHLSVIEEGVYRRLLDHYYESEKPIPSETNMVIRRLRLGGHEDVLSVILAEFFEAREDGHHHARCDDEIGKYHAKAGANRENGKRGGRPKKTEENPNGFENEPTDNLNHKPLTTNQEPEESKALVADESATGDDDLFSDQPPEPVKSKARAKSVVDYDEIMSAYNELCSGKGKLIGCDSLNAERKRLIDKAIELKIAGEKPFKEYGIDYWRAYFSICPNDTHWCGQNDRGWRADFTFVLKEKNIIAALEKNNG